MPTTCGWCIRVFLSGTVLATLALTSAAQQDATPTLHPATMQKLGTVDRRFVSYNVEMVEVTGGRFWKPYHSSATDSEAKPRPPADGSQPVGIDLNLFQYRQPIDLSNPKLRKLAEALGPAYVRVSGTWQNTTFFQDNDQPAPAQPPAGFRAVLTRAEWKGVVDFARATDDRIVTSFSIGAGTRDANGVWTPAQAEAFLNYTKKIGGSIAATEFMNEPTFPGPGGAPAGYDADAFARDAKIFAAFLRKASPQTVFLGPGSTGEGVPLAAGGLKMKLLETDGLMKATGPIFDAFSYHFYGSVSRRCRGTMSADKALDAEWLDRTDVVEAFYAALRDKYLPGRPMWLTETAEAACGGDPFAGEFVDVFRYLNQLGTLAQKGVKTVMHNTLASSDYGLLNENTLEPRPDYWAALLWKRTMGDVVLNPEVHADAGVRVYAHCSAAGKGGVTIVALNTDAEHEHSLTLPLTAQRLTLTAADLTSSDTLLNGAALKAEADGSVPEIKSVETPAGTLPLAAASATFFTVAGAHNKNCN